MLFLHAILVGNGDLVRIVQHVEVVSVVAGPEQFVPTFQIGVSHRFGQYVFKGGEEADNQSTSIVEICDVFQLLKHCCNVDNGHIGLIEIVDDIGEDLVDGLLELIRHVANSPYVSGTFADVYNRVNVCLFFDAFLVRQVANFVIHTT